MQLDAIRRIGVIGAGIMGAGIAQGFAQAGYRVRLQARHAATLVRALAQIRADQAQQAEGGLLSRQEAAESFSRIATTPERALVVRLARRARTQRGFYTYREGESERLIRERNETLIRLLSTLGFTANTTHPPAHIS
jgi:2-polyprenyl-6-methoxyphenol hydroxylase-like FAD-dependent oxidoreductase